MIVLIILTYLGIVYAAFRVFKIKVAPISVAIAALIGVGVVSGILISWQAGAPVSKQITLTRNIIEINGQLKGFITKVNYGIGDPMKEGEVLFEIDPVPYEVALVQAKERLEAAKEQVTQAQAAVQNANANVARTQATAATARTERERAERLFQQGSSAISELQVEQLRNASDAADAAVDQAIATQLQAQSASRAAERNVTISAESIRDAEFNLDLTQWRAPTDGIPIQWLAREKTITTALRASAIGSFMEMDDSRVIVVLPQNLMRKVSVGDSVELAFMSRPGQIDVGTVARLNNYTGEGQFSTGPNVQNISTIRSKGMIAAAVYLDDDGLARSLSLGEAGAAAIYTNDPGPFAVVSKIYLRMLSLMFYLP